MLKSIISVGWGGICLLMKTSTLFNVHDLCYVILLIMILTIPKSCQFRASFFTELLLLEKSQYIYIPRYNVSRQNYGKHQWHSHMIAI